MGRDARSVPGGWDGAAAERRGLRPLGEEWGRLRNGVPGGLSTPYPNTHEFGTRRGRWSFHFRELPVLGEDSELLSPVDAQSYGGDTILLFQDALHLGKGTLTYAGVGGSVPSPLWGDRKRLSAKQHPNRQFFIELGAGESPDAPWSFLPLVEASGWLLFPACPEGLGLAKQREGPAGAWWLPF